MNPFHYNVTSSITSAVLVVYIQVSALGVVGTRYSPHSSLEISCPMAIRQISRHRDHYKHLAVLNGAAAPDSVISRALLRSF